MDGATREAALCSYWVVGVELLYDSCALLRQLQLKFRSHNHLDVPHGNAIIWRYMSLDKFLDLLTHSRLFFSNANNLTDEFDVTLPKSTIEKKKRTLRAQGLAGRDLEEELFAFQYKHHPMRDLTLVNCWSIGRHESYALWKVYLGGSTAGVAIRTSFSKLKKSILSAHNTHPEDIYCGVVKYDDFVAESELSRFRLITTKRKFYEYESELRLFVLNFPRSEGGTKTPYDMKVGRHINIELETLVDEIYVSPFIGPWLIQSLEKIVKSSAPSLATKLRSSSIRDR